MKISRSKHILMTAASVLCLTAGAAPNIGEALKQSPTPANQQTAKIELSLPAIALPPVNTTAGMDFYISRIIVEGAESVPMHELSSLFTHATGRKTSLGELNSICTRITDLYRRKGYFLSRAYVPQQEVKDGVVVLRVVEAKLSEIKLSNSSLASDAAVLRRLSVADVDVQISEGTIGHALAATAELAGVQVSRATVEPGTKTGSTNLLITTTEKARWTGSVYVDNNGALYTGRGRAGLSGAWASPTDAGDILSFNAISTTSAGLTSGYLRYERPTCTSSNLFAQLSQTDYKLGGIYAPLNAHGNAITAEIGLSHTLSQEHRRSRRFLCNLQPEER
jgi:hemolysin activation/secretion protein